MHVDFRDILTANMRLQPQLAGGKRVRATLAALLLVALIGALDFATGYEVRFAILYLIPIGFATWIAGTIPGGLITIAAVFCWGVSFHPSHTYSRDIFYIWEGFVLAATFSVFVLLLARLHLAMQNADRRFRDVLEGLSAAIYAVGEKSGKVLYANRQFIALLDEDPREQPAAKFEHRLKAFSEKTSGSIAAQDIDSFSHYEVQEERTGQWYLVQSGLITWESGERVQLKVLMNITEQKQASAIRHQHQDLLHQTSRSAVLAEIASMLGHEINQPLMAINTYVSAGTTLLSKTIPDIQEATVALDKARIQVERASDIIERTRGFLRRREPAISDSDLNDAVRNAVRSMELGLKNRQLSVDIKLGDNLPTLLFDHTLIEQVIVNLLSNALDAIDSVNHSAGKIEIFTAVDINGSVRFSICDNGPGVKDHIAGQLYLPFFTTKRNGLGLGLSICRSIVEAHAGKLWHETGDGKGMHFHFSLPGIDTMERN